MTGSLGGEHQGGEDGDDLVSSCVVILTLCQGQQLECLGDSSTVYGRAEYGILFIMSIYKKDSFNLNYILCSLSLDGGIIFDVFTPQSVIIIVVLLWVSVGAG